MQLSNVEKIACPKRSKPAGAACQRREAPAIDDNSVAGARRYRSDTPRRVQHAAKGRWRFPAPHRVDNGPANFQQSARGLSLPVRGRCLRFTNARQSRRSRPPSRNWRDSRDACGSRVWMNAAEAEWLGSLSSSTGHDLYLRFFFSEYSVW